MPENETSPEPLARASIQELINQQRPDQALVELKKLPHPQEPWVVLKLGWAYQNQGNIPQAREHLQRFLQTETGVTRDKAEGTHFLALCDFSEKRWPEARAGFAESEAIYVQLNDLGSTAYNHLYLARIDIRENNFKQAQQGINQSLQLFVDSKPDNKGYLSHIFRAQAELELAKGNQIGFYLYAAKSFINSLQIHGSKITSNYIERTLITRHHKP